MLRRCSVLAILLVAAAARAQQVQIEIPSTLRAGERPAITLTPPVAVRGFDLSLQHDGKPWTEHAGGARAGQRVRVPLPGAGHYEGEVVARFTDGNQMTYTLKFDVVINAGSMKIGYARDRLDLDAHTLEFTLSKPAAHAELKVVGEDGKELATATADYHGERAGTWLPIHWAPERAGDVLALELRAVASDGARAGVRLVPWSINVPHKEVVFETGKWDIRKSEEPKLDAAYQKIADEVTRARKAVPDVPVKLYIAGYTDTVGSNADNMKLSLERARAIAAWFRERGLPLPIAYAGFGEEVLRVKTPDNTDNEANRRADYIVAFDEPLIARGVHAQWLKLQ